MARRISGVTCLAVVCVALLATDVEAQKKPPKNPPPNPAGVLYFRRADQVWQMKGDGSEKAPALPPAFTDPTSPDIELPAIGRPSSRLYNGCRWWLYPKAMPDPEATPEDHYHYELWAFCSNPTGQIVDHVQLTQLPEGFSVPWGLNEIQWSNDGEDSFCSVRVGYTWPDWPVTDPPEPKPDPRWYLWRFPTNPLLFGSAIYPMTLDAGELVIDENDHAPTGYPPSKFAWHPSGNQIAYWDLPAKKLCIKTLYPAVVKNDVPLNLPNVLVDMTNLSWSPDKQWIIFFAWTKNSKNEYLNAWWTVHPDGSSLTMLASTGSPSTLGASKKWSLNSEWVSYEADAGAKIFIIKPDKSAGPYDLTSDLKVTGRTPEQRRMLDWVGTTNVEFPLY